MKTTTTLAIALLVCFAASAVTSIPLMSISPVQAQETPSIKTYAISDAIPNPVGVGEPIPTILSP